MPEIVIHAGGGSEHHARLLLQHFGSRAIIESSRKPSVLTAHEPELVITFDEHDCELGLCIAEMANRGVATLQVMDGILEWRRTWGYPTSAMKRPLNQPVLAHKVACLGNVDARIMESWGNVGKCEIVGAPRFDRLVGLGKPMRVEPIRNRPLRLLIMTAKTPGFTPEQVEITYRSLMDVRDVLRDRTNIEVVWRVTQQLHTRLQVQNTFRDMTGGELHEILQQVDAVITTPSTAMLESMLCGLPTALLDYHNCPHYVTAAWRITSKEQMMPAIEDLRSAPLARMLYQDFCLHDALACRTPALPRIVTLIEEMIRLRREAKGRNEQRVQFPHRILADPGDHVSWPSAQFDLQTLYPRHPVFGRTDVTAMQAELEAALGTVERLNAQVDVLTRRLHQIPGYSLAARIKNMLKS
ncbi:MAG TPA: hypothetical protein VFG32_04980 [Bacteroidota bacterium]|nr:hypothetical protein [Bacteroidota bacterium]